MIDPKQGILITKAKAAEILSQASSNVEEIERESHIRVETLGVSRLASLSICPICKAAWGLSDRCSTSAS